VLTPDSLRYFATTVQHLTNQIHEILIAGRATEARVDLQKKEFHQQQIECRKMVELMTDLKGRRIMEVTSRVERVRYVQKKLAVRSDRILQALVDKASPGLSEHETKWFDELKRMKEEVSGAGRYDEGSLSARSKLVSRRWGLAFLTLSSLVCSFSGSMTG
jgi:nucleoporin NUP82